MYLFIQPSCFRRFHVKEWMSLSRYHAPQNEYLEGEHDTSMLESCLTFLATLVNVRTNLGKHQITLRIMPRVCIKVIYYQYLIFQI